MDDNGRDEGGTTREEEAPPPGWWPRLKESAAARAAGAWSAGRERWASVPREVRVGAGVLAAGAAVAGLATVLRPGAVGSTLEVEVSAEAPALTPLRLPWTPEPLVLTFSRSASRLSQTGRPVTAGVALEPRVAGEWRWDSDTRLSFTPLEDWAVGREYEVRLDRALVPEHLRLARRSLTFRTAPFAASVSAAEFHQDPKDPRVKKAVWTLSFSHPVDPKELERLIVVTAPRPQGTWFGGPARPFPFTVQYDDLRATAFVHSAVVPIAAKESAMTLTVPAGLTAARGGPGTAVPLGSEVAVPGMFSYLRVADVELTLPRNARWEPEQVLALTLTAGAKESVVRSHLEAWLLPPEWPDWRPSSGAATVGHLGAAGVGPEALAASTRLALAPVTTEAEYATAHAFRFAAAPGRHVFVRVRRGAEGYGGFILAGDYERLLRVPEFPRELSFVGDGSVLSLSGERKLGVTARGLEAVRFELSRVRPGQLNHLVSQSGGRFKDPDFRSWTFGPDNIAESFSEVLPLRLDDPGRTQYAALDLGRYMTADEPRGLFFLKAEAWDPLRRTASGPSDERLILVTDLGLLVKEAADGSRDVFVMSLKDGAPAEGAAVEVLGKNGAALFTRTTGPDGRASFPSLNGYDRGREPVAFTARRGGDLSFIPFSWGDRRLDLSRFDVGGVSGGGAADGLKAFVFSDRGVYRPGEEIRAGLIIKSGDWERRLAGVPIEVAVTDARGLEVMRRKLALSPLGFEEVRLPTEETAPTGRWEVAAYVVKDERRAALLGSASLRVEEFLPDRLRIAADLPPARGWLSPGGVKAAVTLHNLFGTPAEDRRVSARLTLAPAAPALPGYPDHVFFDPAAAKSSFDERLDEARTDAEGRAEFALPLERFEKATYRLTFSAEGFEAGGGRGVYAEASALVSDRPFLVGYRPDGDLQRVRKSSARSVEVVAVGPDLERADAGPLTAVLLERRWVSTLQRQANGVYRYQSVLRETEAERRPLALPPAGTRLTLPTERPGEFVYSLRDASGLELCRVPFAVTGAANLTRQLEKDAELEVRLDRADYAPGDEVEVSLKAPYAGAGLVTIERDRVYAARWFKAGTSASVQRIRVPEGLEGNAYVHVAFVRAPDSPEVYMSPLSYAAVPFSLSRERRDTGLRLEAAAVAVPGTPLRIRYSSRRPGRAVVFAVDEGVLQVGRTATPDPLGFFMAKRALEVGTHQMLDLLLPEFKLLGLPSAPGGDRSGALGRNLNPFKRRRDPPVAYWSGLVDTGPEERELSYAVPAHFNGTLRLMAVAVSPDAVGAAERRTLVRAPFVLSPNLPTFAAPGDSFVVPVAVANNVAGSGPDAEVRLSAAATGGLSVEDGAARVLKVPEGREATALFKVRARVPLGNAELAFTAEGAGQRSALSATLSVRPPVPYRTTLASGRVAGGRATVEVGRRMHKEFKTLDASASALPLGMARGLMHYLEKYPYGCSEQIVSRAWPALAVVSRPELGLGRAKAAADVETVIRMLQGRQNADGAFGFWAANSYVSDFHAAYGLHFLTEAREKGHHVPPDMLAKGLVYLRTVASGEGGGLGEERTRAYAAYVLARNGQQAAPLASAIEARLEREAPKEWRSDPAAAYLAAVHRIQQDPRRADLLTQGLRLAQRAAADYLHFYDPLARDSQILYLYAKHFPEKLRAVRGEDLQTIADGVAGGSYNSLSSAYAVIALAAYADAVGADALDGLTVAAELPGGRSAPVALPKGLFPKAAFPPETRRLLFESPGPVFYQTVQAGFDLEAPKEAVSRGLEVSREYRDASGKAVAEAALGSELSVVYRVRATEGHTVPHAAFVDLLPGGFEPVLESLPRFGPAPARAPAAEEGDGDPEDGPEYDVPPSGGWAPEYVDAREDRVVFFGTAGPELSEFTYRIKAVNRGTYAVPPTFAESMYDRSVQAQGLAGAMTVR
ncbi:alpha-2-macroglobulin family protein [bacterium]|nr:MAG: alpha-2-macroglobulin family protein [bacterium]